MARPIMIVGNWKMHKTRVQAAEFIVELSQKIGFSSDVYLAAPSTAIDHAAKSAHPFGIQIGTQNISEHLVGAYTGEISAEMAKEAGAVFALVGHSERRTLYHETSEMTSQKIKRCLEEELKVVLCIGETEQERKSGKTNEILQAQLLLALEGLSEKQLQYLSIAYEPVWAIGTGHTATPEMAQQVHMMCRSIVGDSMQILYGGSVNEKTIADLMIQKDIDGVLVGGASLQVDSFAKIITISRNIKK